MDMRLLLRSDNTAGILNKCTAGTGKFIQECAMAVVSIGGSKEGL